MLILQICTMIFLSLALLIAFYYVILAVVALTHKRRYQSKISEQPIKKFALVVPAHNEQDTLSRTLESFRLIDYPNDLFEVFVVADNCTDNTVDVAKEYGVNCLERFNNENRGKGFALSYVFEEVLRKSFDAVVVIDADCEIDSHSLKVFDAYLREGFQALQANDIAANPDDSPMSYAVAVGNIIENDLYYAAKTELGLPVVLRGTGMVLSTELLRAYPWEASTIVEDMEYSLLLTKAGVQVKFVIEAAVRSDFPATREQLDIQRTRWAAGNLGYGKSDALNFIKEGISKGPLALIDVGWNMLVLSRPLVLLELFIALLLSIVCYGIEPDGFSYFMLQMALVLVSVQVVYFTLGIYLLGITAHRMALLVEVPVVVLRLLVISIKGLLGAGKDQWTRTPRD